MTQNHRAPLMLAIMNGPLKFDPYAFANLKVGEI